jgi:hypothetical protein
MINQLKQIGILLIGILILSSFIIAKSGDEKAEYTRKTGEVTKGGNLLFYLDEIKGKQYEFSLKNASKKELMYITFDHFVDPNSPTLPGSNAPNQVNYYKLLFFNNNKTAEIRSESPKNLARTIDDNKLIVNGEIDTIAQARFIIINGNEFSKKRDRIINNGNTIIINNQAPPSNGMNFHIGN